MRAAKVDANQAEIVEALRRVGAIVQVTSKVGGGFPDLVVGFRGNNYILEIKDGDKPPSARRLTEEQELWHARWRGSVVVVGSVVEALHAIGIEVDFMDAVRETRRRLRAAGISFGGSKTISELHSEGEEE